ncbi:MAG: VTT domain-containing protein [Candidatus Pacebacteria bacterium]|nr:VTT domain-containing protein [Candidatus Paceibacterota bacterium]MCF7856967.1 VTT domain-containing protein [Candidatus Paceibacterota bacterium]
MKLIVEVGVVVIVLALLGATSLLSGYLPVENLMLIADENRVLGAFLFTLIMFATTVLAPLTAIPLVPMVAPFLGPFTTGVACFTGWILGAVVAFVIGKKYGQPFVSRFIDMQTIKKYESYIKPDISFLMIVVLRMVVPVDVLSYALGIFTTTISLRTYTLASMIGIVWFSFALAYAGDALVSRNYVLLMSISVASVVILYFSWRYVRRVLGTTENKSIFK